MLEAEKPILPHRRIAMARRKFRVPRTQDPARGDHGDDRMYTIGELAAAHGITTRAIRFYEARGLISPARKGIARAYGRRDRARLLLIMRGKNLGFSLEDIMEFLSLYDADPSQMAQTRLLLQKVETHISSLETKRKDLERTLRDLKDIRALCVGHLSEGRT
jgi:DNA-binding transcriptional MerR regulator